MVNIYKSELTLLQQEILRLLFIKAGNPLNQRRISQILQVSQPAVQKSLPRLEEQRLIKMMQDKDSKRWAIELDRDNKTVVYLKRADNFKQIIETGLEDYLHEKLPGTTIILFGSYSNGEDTINSDIDIAVIGGSSKNLDLSKFEKMLERKIVVNYYKSFKDINKHLLNNMLNGIVLKGAVEI